MANYCVWYMKPEFFRDGIMGVDWCRKKGIMPTPATINETHVLLKDVNAANLEAVFYNMQGEVWSPNGEARELIRSKNLEHTSMSVGDVVEELDTGKWFMVDRFGFKPLAT